jgi:CO/xanthine dehydrogenase FAD-binding subunit
MEFVTPSTPQAAQALADALGSRVRFIAGGTVVQQEWDEPRLAPGGVRFIDVQAWPQSRGIVADGTQLRIGAAECLEAVRRHALVRQHAPLLVEALGQLGALGVRHLGTLGGNVGWGMGDAVPVLLALDAQAELADGRCVALDQVLQQPVRPLLLALCIPQLQGHAVFEKVGYRAAFSPARLCVALRWQVATRGLGLLRAAAAAPGLNGRRLHAVEALLSTQGALMPDLAAVRQACMQDGLPAPLARIACRLVAGHCSLLT